MPLRFVHLSDIHFGQEKHGTGPINDDVRRELLRDCKRMISNGHIIEPATGILLTGDVAYSGKESEFKRAVEWLDELASIIKCDRKQVQVIPGNHDVDLQTLDDQAKLFQGMLRKMSVEDIQAYLNTVADNENHPLMQKLADYRSFAGAYGSDFKSTGQPITIKSYSLEGGKDIRIVGLCSVLISDLSDNLDTMYLGQNQYVVPRSDDHEDIVMVHHPLAWFKDRALAEKYLNGRARVLMSGHEHLPKLTVVRHDNDFEQIHVAAGAVNPPNAGGQHVYTYNWLEFSWSEEHGRKLLNVTVYPRKWNFDRTEFEADYHRTGGAISKTLKLDCGRCDDNLHVTHEVVEGLVPIENVGLELIQIPESNAVPEEVTNVQGYELLRFLFWRYATKEQRQKILADVGLLRLSHNVLPPAFERHAFERASEENKLGAVWEATMQLVPDAEKRPNPFQ
ncbi:metallophosphoesterase [Rhizobium phaseoli]|uniref:Calcineurin-like phosphoesterase domain-containing protein n=1 Tax=Rhizobium phaseoli TaxID=396 RepID=A0ABM6CLJ5_9HYPH|nr:metallophosphoesterase [Rhizobium phaseoli]KEC69691.1 hypothetical protein RLPCCGM1_p1723 [Rhizobium leguminosarum bv. phaseoli CCGM1]ANL57328.1 calcineurin-like phosphoesterase domain-containing protein [Rhizobium phaseoli]ANL89225.1 calcineurin-like phosphoesterase domain-containing protein [Rhizobium phaseoli]ANL95734.1 calcineurin-like phosphoesterase domain-containing protein [Rhizobium phaseoli]PWI51007.1 hypothetical protein B5K03_27360 [Rhizobium phaseoli]